jgi:SAM-dependent methyltransferase
MGSGLGSQALAALYPRLEVVGVDIDETVVERARRTHRLPNLSFTRGDIAAPVFPPASLDGIFDSSVLHHVTSYRGYRHENAAEALATQIEQLRPHGVLVVRDFLDPGGAPVLLDVPADDGADSDDPARASTAALLERFAREFRSLSDAPGFPLERVDAPVRPGWRRYRLSHKHAAEFVLRKDYRADWATEVQEEYTYFTQAQFEQLFSRLGLRILASTPLHNPWIVRHRFEGRFALRGLEGQPLALPATNYIIVGERTPAGEGVRMSERREDRPPRFLRLEHHRHRSSGRVYDLAARPHPTIDIVPYFFEGDTVYVVARTGYPRPILGAARGEGALLDGSGAVDYVTEPLNVIQTDAPLGQTVEERLERAAGLPASRIRRVRAGTTYYPSPGGILEEVRSVLVEIDPQYVNAPLEGVSGFSTSGRVRAIEARQLLRAAQVGGLPDARLELNVHDLLLQLGLAPGPWIGDELPGDGAIVEPTPLAELLGRPGRRLFERSDPAQSTGFLEVRCAAFDEDAAGGRVVASRSLEYVVPRPLGCNTVAAALLARARDGRALLGVDEDDLPAAQSFSGNSNILVAPAWRAPRTAQTMIEARAFVLERLRAEYGLEVGGWCALGGPYRPSPGLTPEVVFPLAFAVKEIAPAARPLAWVPLDELVEQRHRIPDGHLRILALRAAHARV